jgi:hypothetical protein
VAVELDGDDEGSLGHREPPGDEVGRGGYGPVGRPTRGLIGR